ncbi:hypothetical protein [Aquimarina aquimarini]|nr:hypothetical protein [Aquimarina aquimarini]
MLISAGLLIPLTLTNCSGGTILLDDSIGKSENILKSFTKQGDDFFSYYTISKSNCSHPLFSGEESFIFCQKQKIIGFTIKMNGITDIKKYNETLNQLYGANKKVYENDFGEEYEWKNETRKIILSYSKQESKVPQNTFYSESLLNKNLLIF